MLKRVHLYSACGNILLIVDKAKYPPSQWSEVVVHYAKQNNLLDGVIFLDLSPIQNVQSSLSLSNSSNEYHCILAKWIYYNRDGTTADFCGNAVRCIGYCLSQILMSPGYQDQECQDLTGYIFNELSNIKTFFHIKQHLVYFQSPSPYEDLQFSTNLIVSLLSQSFPSSLFYGDQSIIVKMIIVGVPHLVIHCHQKIFGVSDNDIDCLANSIYQKAMDNNFNINFIYLLSPHQFQIRTVENGVFRETLCCASGTIASYYSLLSFFIGHIDQNKECTVYYKGGDTIRIYYNHQNHSIYLGGVVTEID